MVNPKSRSWLIIGSGPSAPQWIDQALGDCGGANVAAVNSSIELIVLRHTPRWPDFYWISDPLAVWRHYLWARAASRWHGTQILTAPHAADMLKARGVDVTGGVCGVPERQSKREYRPGFWHNCRHSGAFCIQYAVRFNPQVISLVGFDGYQGNPKRRPMETFDGDHGAPHSSWSTQRDYGPAMQQMIDAHQGVRFTFYGQPVYPITGENVKVLM